MARNPIIREPERKVPAGPERCIHCSRGWVYEADEETGEDAATPCWMCDTLDAQYSALER